jgi:hypothetical protein
MPPTAAKTRVSEGRSAYQALTNISVPLVKDGKEQDRNELISPGSTVMLTEEQAANLMATGGRTGRQYPAVRPLSEQVEDMPRLLPRHFAGRVRQPVTPPPDSDQPRPDPPGSSEIRVVQPDVPESAEPQPGDETGMPTGAIDLPPRRSRTAAT